MKWINEKENLIKYIQEDKLSYEEIGRKYNCSGNNIKKIAKKLGIELQSRRIINSSETFNKGTGWIYFKKFGLNQNRQLVYKNE